MTFNFLEKTTMSSADINILWLYGMPRSGTTWISQIFASSPNVRLKLCPLFSYEFKNACDELSTAQDWKELFKTLYNTESEFLDQHHLRNEGLIPEFKLKDDNPEWLVIKSNRYHHLMPYLLAKVDTIQLVYIARNPCASLSSWFNDPKEFPKSAEPLDEWRGGNCRKNAIGEYWGFDDWVNVTQQAVELSAQYSERHSIIRYEDFLSAPEQQTMALFSQLEIPYHHQIADFIGQAQTKHNPDTHSVFRGQLDREAWRSKLDEIIITTCYSELEKTNLKRFL